MNEVATPLLLVIFALVLAFHVLVVLKVIPYGIVWGGRLRSDAMMYRFETVSILLNLFFMFVIAVRAGHLDIAVSSSALTVTLWIMAALFLVNTIGNWFSKSQLEKWVFTPLTLVLSVLVAMLAMA